MKRPNDMKRYASTLKSSMQHVRIWLEGEVGLPPPYVEIREVYEELCLQMGIKRPYKGLKMTVQEIRADMKQQAV